MSDSMEERPFGWFRVALVALLTAAGPVWLLCTAIAIQLSPDLNGTTLLLDGGIPVIEPVTLSAWVRAGTRVALWMVFTLPFVLAVVTLGSFGWQALRIRGEAERARYDAMVADDAVIDDPSWRE